jgi:hypothetical protein
MLRKKGNELCMSLGKILVEAHVENVFKVGQNNVFEASLALY